MTQGRVDSRAEMETDRADPIPQRMTLSPWSGAAGIIILWHFRSSLLILIFISVTFPSQTIRDWNALPDSLIYSAEGAEEGVTKFTSLVRARDLISLIPVSDCRFDVSPVNNSNSDMNANQSTRIQVLLN